MGICHCPGCLAGYDAYGLIGLATPPCGLVPQHCPLSELPLFCTPDSLRNPQINNNIQFSGYSPYQEGGFVISARGVRSRSRWFPYITFVLFIFFYLAFKLLAPACTGREGCRQYLWMGQFLVPDVGQIRRIWIQGLICIVCWALARSALSKLYEYL